MSESISVCKKYTYLQTASLSGFAIVSLFRLLRRIPGILRQSDHPPVPQWQPTLTPRQGRDVSQWTLCYQCKYIREIINMIFLPSVKYAAVFFLANIINNDSTVLESGSE